MKIDLDQIPLSEWLWEVKGNFRTVHLNIPPGLWRGIEPVVPIDRSPEGATMVPWESWVYLNIGDGLEFVFTDRYMRGSWDFPLQPNTICMRLWGRMLFEFSFIPIHANCFGVA